MTISHLILTHVTVPHLLAGMTGYIGISPLFVFCCITCNSPCCTTNPGSNSCSYGPSNSGACCSACSCTARSFFINCESLTGHKSKSQESHCQK
jgi:hypothetical protein